MNQTIATNGTALLRILDPATRADPYPVYTSLREEPVARQDDGTWLISGFDEVAALLHDPRISVDLRASGIAVPDTDSSLLQQDAPNHERLRGAVMEHFTPARIRELGATSRALVDRLLDRAGRSTDGAVRIDVVDEVAYPLPVTVICHLLGVPEEDEGRFKEWADAVVLAADGLSTLSTEAQKQVDLANSELSTYLGDLLELRRRAPGDDLLSGMVASGSITFNEVVTTARLLLIAGHETTVNLIANGTLTLLRRPDVLERLRAEPELVVPMTEELLRYEPSVHLRHRGTLADISMGGHLIPAGSHVVLLLAAASRDPRRVERPDEFVPDRSPNEHFGFGGGIHYCIGAPLARMETHAALVAISQRLVAPRLVSDPPVYRAGAALRGPLHLEVDVETIAPAQGN